MDASLYQRPNKPRTMTVTRRREAPAMALPVVPEIVTVDKLTECHVTPPDVARRMVSYLGDTDGRLVLEPSAGTGNLIQALCDAGHSLGDVLAVERHYSLCEAIEKRFNGALSVSPVQDCFFDYSANAHGKITFSRIVMNPPFKRVKQHMASALRLLADDDAALVALVPISYQHDEAEILEELPRDTFSTVQVSTKIIQLQR